MAGLPSNAAQTNCFNGASSNPIMHVTVTAPAMKGAAVMAASPFQQQAMGTGNPANSWAALGACFTNGARLRSRAPVTSRATHC